MFWLGRIFSLFIHIIFVSRHLLSRSNDLLGQTSHLTHHACHQSDHVNRPARGAAGRLFECIDARVVVLDITVRKCHIVAL